MLMIAAHYFNERNMLRGNELLTISNKKTPREKTPYWTIDTYEQTRMNPTRLSPLQTHARKRTREHFAALKQVGTGIQNGQSELVRQGQQEMSWTYAEHYYGKPQDGQKEVEVLIGSDTETDMRIAWSYYTQELKQGVCLESAIVPRLEEEGVRIRTISAISRGSLEGITWRKPLWLKERERPYRGPESGY
jgi:hypothetical protein